MMVPGLFSWLTTVRNGAEFIGEAVDSILGQTDGHFEAVVVNDGSTDDTAAILARSSDPRLIVLTLPPVGRAAALARAARQAQGEFFAVLDGDDVALPHRLAIQRAYLGRHPEVALVGSRAVEFDAGSEWMRPSPVGPAAVRRCLGMYNPFYFSSVAFRRQAYEAVGGFRESDGWGVDLAFLIRMAARFPVDILPEPLIRYRRHPRQATASAAWERWQRLRSARLQLRAARQLGLPFHLWAFPLLGWLYAWLPVGLRPRGWTARGKRLVLRLLGGGKSASAKRS
jgi:glycosyltransferase involved in cell wall biosynthesis